MTRNIGEQSVTIRLYAQDSYLREFRARVILSGPKFVVLDRTAFYPESGGQPSDTGVIDWEGGAIKVHKVMVRRGKIFHYLMGDIPQSSLVQGKIDWDPRYYNMRRHSAEHLLTGLFETINAGPKVYSDLERLDFKPSDLDSDAVSQVKARFNEIVDQDVQIRSYYIDRSKLDVSGDERKLSFLKKIPKHIDMLRIVDISGYASTFCFGTHVKSTRELGKLSELRLKLGKKGRKIVQFTLE